jgi:GR25 family glycosyltransferase involved in LPS biosynthesis
MLEHHAFFMVPRSLAGDGSIDRTLLLWAGIKAGGVPVLLPPASQDRALADALALLSDPLAIVNASSFASADDLADHLASAQAEPAVLEIHQQWRRVPFGANLSAALQNLPARLPCQVCDYVIEHQQRFSVVRGAMGSALVMPACLAPLYSQPHLPVVYDWAAAELQVEQRLPVYVASLSTATDRHTRLKQQLASGGLRASLLTGFDKAQLDEQTAACWYPQSPFEGRSVMKERKSLGLGEVSLAVKHFVGYLDIIRRGLRYALILEDDVSFDSASFHASLHNATAALPNGWDMLFLGGCREPPSRTAKAIAAVHSQSGAWGSFAYLVSEQGVFKMLQSLPLRWPIDFQINAAVQELGLRVFCTSELIVRHVDAGPSFLEPERARVDNG